MVSRACDYRDGSVHLATMEDTQSTSDCALHSTLSSDSFSAAEINTLRRLMTRMEYSSSASTSMANAGISCQYAAPQSSLSWIIDSGASEHMSGDSRLFQSYRYCSTAETVRVADGSHVPIHGRGSTNCIPSLPLSSVMHVPSFPSNLLSVHRVTESLNCSVTFFPSHCVFQDLSSGKVLGRGKVSNGLYMMEGQSIPPSLAYSVSSNPVLESLYQWHRRLGHPSFGVLEHMFPHLTKKCKRADLLCEPCELAKHKRSVYPSRNNRSSSLFSVIHTDVWGPHRAPTYDGFRWFVVFVDCHSRLTWVYLLKHKNEVFRCFQSFHNMLRTQFNATVKILRSDNGTEYEGPFRSYLDSFGIIHQTTCVKTSQQNGVAERKIGHITQVARSLMLTMHVPLYLWGDAVCTASYLINRLPSSALQFRTPRSFIPDQSGPLDHKSEGLPPRLFGSVCFVHNIAPSRGKLDPRALRCVFIGYSSTQKGYRCYHPPSRRTYVSYDVTFWETVPYFSPGSSSTLQGETHTLGEESESELSARSPSFFIPSCLPIHTPSQGEPTIPPQGEPTIPPLTTSIPVPSCLPIHTPSQEEPTIPPLTASIPVPDATANRTPDLMTYSRRKQVITNLSDQHTSTPEADPKGKGKVSDGKDIIVDNLDIPTIVDDLDIPIALRKGTRSCTNHPIADYVSYHALSVPSRAFVSSLSKATIPQTWQEANSDPKWRAAMVEEMDALKHNDTFLLSTLPTGKKTVGCKWVFTVKQRPDGVVERYKARLVAKGYTQTYGIDYQETFAPVAKMSTIRILISCAAHLGWELQQLDVKNAFLNGVLEEEVYMDVPPGFTSPETSGKVCRLKKTLYGLKQSPRAWFSRFNKAMLKFGYKPSNADHTLFTKRKNGKITVLIVYVDDIVLTGNDMDEMKVIKRQLASEFQMKDLGELKYFLGIEVFRSPTGIFLSQRKYTLDLLSDSGMLGCKAVDSPVDADVKLEEKVGETVDRERYQRLVGRLLYLAHTRPDIAFAVGVVSRFMHDPREPHMEAAYRILRYLKGAPGKGLMFTQHNHFKIEIYTDADWGMCRDDRRSTGGYCIFVGGNLVAWRSKKQHVVSRSTAEAEYRAMADGVANILWTRGLLRELGYVTSSPSTFYCDNKAAIDIAHDPVQHDRTKHIEIDRHFIKENIHFGNIALQHVKSEDQLADVLTKGLNGKKFCSDVCKLGMRDIYAPT